MICHDFIALFNYDTIGSNKIVQIKFAIESRSDPILFTIKNEGDHNLRYDWTRQTYLYSPTDHNDTLQLNTVHRVVCLLQD